MTTITATQIKHRRPLYLGTVCKVATELPFEGICEGVSPDGQWVTVRHCRRGWLDEWPVSMVRWYDWPLSCPSWSLKL